MIKTIFILMIFIANISFANIEKIFEGQTSIKKPFELRDPFQPPKFQTINQKKRSASSRGVWSNEKKLEEEVKIEDVKVTGVLIGVKRRVTLQVGTDKTSYTLREGEPLGLNGPEVKAILPGGIILAEKISNIYGEPEFIETVIPISE